MTRPVVGVVIGGINLIACIVASCYIIFMLVRLGQVQDNTDSNAIKKGICIFLLILCLLSICASCLLIWGIVKKRSKLMAPWVFLTISGIIMNIINLAVCTIKGAFNDSVLYSIGLLVIQILMLYPIYSLYKNIRSLTINRKQVHSQPNVVSVLPNNHGEVHQHST